MISLIEKGKKADDVLYVVNGFVVVLRVELVDSVSMKL